MLSVPIALPRAMGSFAPVFARPVWPHGQVLRTGAVLAPGKRTVTAMLRRMGRRAAPDFQTEHRVLHRAIWAPRKASRWLLRLRVAVCLPQGGVVLGLEDTIERRRGAPLQAQGLARDPVRSSHAPVVHARGLRWLAWRVLAPLAWAARVWALPWLSVLGPAERCSPPRGRRPQPVTARAWPRMRRVVRWWPGRESVWVADRRGAALERRDTGKPWPRGRGLPRLRLDAALDDPPPPRAPGTQGRPRLQGQRRPPREAGWADERTQWTPVRVPPG